MRHVVVMVTSSYPRFPGDTVGTFMEPIAHGVAARGHEVHVVAPWHPRLARGPVEGAVHFHFYRYAPHRTLNVFGYAGGLREDVAVRWSAWAAAPLALAAGWWTVRRVARRVGATVMHGHWVVPGGATAWTAAPGVPLVVSLHGSDVFVAERHATLRHVARAVLERAGWVTACSEDLRARAVAIGASPARSEVVPYGVDPTRFQPSPTSRQEVRADLGLDPRAPLVVAAGRLVRKKGFEYLVDAVGQLVSRGREAWLVIAGDGDLAAALRERTVRTGISGRVFLPGAVSHARIARWLSAADVVVVPSVRDDAGNVDGLPNIVMESLATGAAVVATSAGGIAAVVRHDVTGLIVPERDPDALAEAVGGLLSDPGRRRRLGEAARQDVIARFGWDRVAERFEAAYDRASHARG